MYRQILVPIDVNDPHSYEKALPTAATLAKTFGAKLHVVTVLPDFGLPLVAQYFPADFASKAAASIDEELVRVVKAHVPADLAVDHGVAHGSIYQEILRVAAELPADLIVMGSHRPALRDYLLGPNSALVVRHSVCSVMVVRG